MAFPVRFLPDNRSWSADEPVDLVLAAAGCDILLEQPCGSKAVCGKCRVRVVEGEVPAGAEDLRVLGAEAVADGWRLGCRITLDRPTTLEVSPAVRSTAAKAFGDEALLGDGIDPPVHGAAVSLTTPDEALQAALPHRPPPGAIERLALALRAAAGLPRTNGKGAPAAADPTLRSLAPSAAALRALGRALRQGPDVRAWLDEDGRLLTVETAQPRDSGVGAWGAAIDVGSTTLAVALVDLADGRVLASASGLNPQAPFGADVISRIAWAQERADGPAALHRALVHGLDALLARGLEGAVAGAGGQAQPIRALAAVGNPTMLHTLVGVDPASLGQAPYVGLWRGPWRGTARELGLELPEATAAYVLPGVGSHVGADTVAAIVATGLDRAARPTLLVDLGTNSEVVLGCRDYILCASTSAGPAFEGAAIQHGMRAAPGAIEQVRVRPTGSILVRVIGGEDARGICGSGLVDAAAELLRVGVIEPSGRMGTRDELAGLVPPRLLDRLSDAPPAGRAVRLAGSAERPVLFTAADVRQLQLVKGSIAAGMRVLLARKGLSPGDLGDVLIAGAFGNYLRKTSAQAIGLVPPVDPERVRFVGNAAGAGARAVLCDRGFRRRAEEVALRAEYLELADAPEYGELFAEAMAFPGVLA